MASLKKILSMSDEEKVKNLKTEELLKFIRREKVEITSTIGFRMMLEYLTSGVAEEETLITLEDSLKIKEASKNWDDDGRESIWWLIRVIERYQAAINKCLMFYASAELSLSLIIGFTIEFTAFCRGLDALKDNISGDLIEKEKNYAWQIQGQYTQIIPSRLKITVNAIKEALSYNNSLIFVAEHLKNTNMTKSTNFAHVSYLNKLKDFHQKLMSFINQIPDEEAKILIINSYSSICFSNKEVPEFLPDNFNYPTTTPDVESTKRGQQPFPWFFNGNF
jgi:hypothetical protein